MSSFFTAPASTRKRKRSESTAASRGTKSKKSRESYGQGKKAPDDEDISSESGSGEEGQNSRALSDGEGEGEEEDYSEETAAEKRLRLAQQYLDNLHEEADKEGFDAADIDRDIIAERLKESVAEEKGKIYRHIASELSFASATSTLFRMDTTSTTDIATCSPFIYTTTKDGYLIKWGLPTYPAPPATRNFTPPRKPKRILYARASRKETKDGFQGHTGPIWCVAASEDGKFVATGGVDTRVVVWSAETLKVLKAFKFHRGTVTGLAFRRGTNQLYSCSTDRTVKLWSLDELAYVETLFGHQDQVVGITALAGERCVTVGARDRTARLWKIVEETQLVFRGGGGIGDGSNKPRKSKDGAERYEEGSIDCVAMIDEEHFVTGSDNGGISLWSIHKKKPVHTIPVAHGLQPALPSSQHSAETHPTDPPPPPQPHYITAVAAVPYSDLVLSGSWDGHIRVWKVSADKRKLEPAGVVGADTRERPIRGVVNGISIIERGEKGKGGIVICVGTGQELRMGQWLKVEGRNGGYVLEVERKLPGRGAQVRE